MNTRQRNFITRKLIPFILREAGNGFTMSRWKDNVRKYSDVNNLNYDYDNTPRTKIPACGTIACIGGSVQHLTGVRSARKIAKDILGLSIKEAHGLFYVWQDNADYSWPKDLQDKFADADTPLRKARVAVSLLKRVMRTNGKCLHNSEITDGN